MINTSKLYLLVTVILLFSCNPTSESRKHFVSELDSGKTPWSYEPKAGNEDQFTFAIVSDLNGGEREGIFEVAIEQLNLLRPQFILSVGDLVNGETDEIQELQQQYDSFDQRAAKAKAPIFHVGGNHDLTSPVMRNFWEERYGRRYYYFIYEQVLFLVLDTEDYTDEFRQKIHEARTEAIAVLDGDHPENFELTEYYKMEERKTGKLEEEQNAYFEKVIADHPDVRWTFVLMHKPVWQRQGEGNLSRIEAALGARNYTVINGHVHSYSHTEKNGHDYITLGTTGGAQNAKDANAFDHITVVSFDEDGPSMANLRLEGILDKTGKIPLNGEQYCYQASACTE
ncbi:MAG TPA: hypothetical protein DIS90_11120 [Cytophagales bacterium]|nr:hypothetical protein [Cytophagales bacterium]